MNNLRKKFHSLPKAIQFVLYLVGGFLAFMIMDGTFYLIEFALNKIGVGAPLWNFSMSPISAIFLFILFVTFEFIDEWWNKPD